MRLTRGKPQVVQKLILIIQGSAIKLKKAKAAVVIYLSDL